MYSKPLGAIIRRYGLCYHFYADDTQLYISFKPNVGAAQTDSLELIERCLTDIERWMRVNMLKLNSEMTEVVLFTSKHNTMQMNVTVRVGDTDITSVNSVKNLGVIFDSAMNMEQHLNSVCRSGYYQLRNIVHIRRYLTNDATQPLVNRLVASRLDYCNALLSGLHQTSINNIGHTRRYLTTDVTQSLVNGLVASRLDYCNALLSGLHQTSINNIGHIRRYLTTDITQSLVNGLVASRLDYCNALLSGLHQTSINNIGHIRRYLTTDITQSLVNGLVASRLDYCNALLSGLHQTSINNIGHTRRYLTTDISIISQQACSITSRLL